MGRGIADLPLLQVPAGALGMSDFARREAAFAEVAGPIFRYRPDSGPAAGENLVFMLGAAANRFVMHTERHRFSHDKGWTPIVGELMGRGLLNMDDPPHDAHRKMWNPAFTTMAMAAYLPVLQRIIVERTANWPAEAVSDVYLGARDITFDAAAAALAGFERGADVDRMRELFFTLLHGFDANLSDGDNMMRMYNANMALREMLTDLIVQRRAGELAGDVLSQMLDAVDDEGVGLSDEQLLGHLMILLVAGHETTTTLSAWALYMVAKRPELRQRLVAELEAARAAAREDGESWSAAEPPPLSVLRQLSFMDNFIKETGRLFPPVLHAPRGVLSPFEFAGYEIPAGTRIRLALAGTHLLPSIFADPFTFDPDRFAPPRREDRETPYGLVTFGGGPRICIGINFANIEVKLLLAHMLQHYDIALVDGQEYLHAGYWTAYVPYGVKLRISPRH